MMIKRTPRSGFTLLEVLLVVAAIGILAAIVIVAINPGKQLADTRNAQRKVDVNTISSAVYQYMLDNNGTVPEGITTSAQEICNSGVQPEDCAAGGFVDLAVLTTDEKYVVAIPKDPSTGSTGNGSGYFINKTDNNRILVSATGENSAVISVTR